MKILLLGSGPSASRLADVLASVQPDAVAAVNGSIALCENAGFLPKFYGVFETDASKLFHCEARRVHANGGTCYVSPQVAAHREWEGVCQPVTPGVHLPDGFQLDPPGQNNRTSGALLLYVLAHYHKPLELHALGLDGYAPVNSYAKGIAHAASWIGGIQATRLNTEAAYLIGKVTKRYTDTRFVWHSRPPFAQLWRVDYAL